MKKYKARVSRRWGCKAVITEVDIDKETDKSVWIDGDRFAKSSEWDTYFDTWEKAHSALIDMQNMKIRNCRDALQCENSKLDLIKKMVEVK